MRSPADREPCKCGVCHHCYGRRIMQEDFGVSWDVAEQTITKLEADIESRVADIIAEADSQETRQ